MAKNSQTVPDGRIPSAYFLSLAVRNIRCFGDEEQTLSLTNKEGKPAQWTILLGNNGTGKTTLLQALAGFEGVMAPDHSIVARPFYYWLSRGRGGNVSRFGGLPARLRAQLAHGTRFNPASDGFQKHEMRIELGEGQASWNGMSRSGYPRCFGYGASRRLSPAVLGKMGADDSTHSLFSDDAFLRNPEEWLLKLDYSASKDSPIQGQQKKRLAQIKELLLKILPEVEEIRLTAPDTTHPDPTVEFKTPYGWVSMSNLGHGYRTSIAWMVDFASRLVEEHPDSEDPLAEPAVALIDEIDLHLHPVWQRDLMRHLTLCFPNTQFIVTAHSPLIVQAAPDANLVLLKRVDNHVVIQNDLQSVRGWRIDQVLTSDLFGLESARPPQYDDLLRQRREILTKATLTSQDRKRLKKLEEQLGELPAGEGEIMGKVQELLEEARKITRAAGSDKR